MAQGMSVISHAAWQVFNYHTFLCAIFVTENQRLLISFFSVVGLLAIKNFAFASLCVHRDWLKTLFTIMGTILFQYFKSARKIICNARRKELLSPFYFVLGLIQEARRNAVFRFETTYNVISVFVVRWKIKYVSFSWNPWSFVVNDVTISFHVVNDVTISWYWDLL